MLIDCDTCSVRGTGCGDCVVSVLLGTPPSQVELDDTERRALDVLADAGLVPPLRLLPLTPRRPGLPPASAPASRPAASRRPVPGHGGEPSRQDTRHAG